MFQTTGDYSGWKRFAQMFNPFSKSNDLLISIGTDVSLLPRCITVGGCNSDSTSFVLVLLVNTVVVRSSFHMASFEECVTKV